MQRSKIMRYSQKRRDVAIRSLLVQTSTLLHHQGMRIAALLTSVTGSQ